MSKLYTVAEWRALKPRAQGWVLYMQADLPGSPLRRERCPYAEGTKERAEFQAGEQAAVQEVQDGEE